MPATTLPPEIREKLAKLLLLLSSSHEGERAAATAAIARTLTTAGFDWHDMANALTAAAPPPLRPAWSDDEDDTESVSGAELRKLIEALRARRRFNARSEGFLDSMLARAGATGPYS